jgi:hypothetical protein
MGLSYPFMEEVNGWRGALGNRRGSGTGRSACQTRLPRPQNRIGLGVAFVVCFKPHRGRRDPVVRGLRQGYPTGKPASSMAWRILSGASWLSL